MIHQCLGMLEIKKAPPCWTGWNDVGSTTVFLVLEERHISLSFSSRERIY